MRPDYCPIANEPCQSLCDTPCSVQKLEVRRKWVGLTDEEIDACWDGPLSDYQRQHIREMEQALKEKNT